MNPPRPRLLLAYHTDPAQIPPAVLAADQILCGPFVEDRTEAGRIIALRTPAGEYDIRKIVERLPRAQRPELLIVKADATGSNLPRGIGALGLPAVLVIGDTHHLEQPLRTLLRYARAEPFVATILGHNRQHLHWFVDAGCVRVAWLPAMLWHDHPTPFLHRREHRACFVAHHQRYHLQRRRVIDALRASGRPVLIGQARPEQAALYHATSLMSLNCSLNGDVNLRVFEVMAAGGCLLTDRLAPQSGLEMLFRNGAHMMLYDGVDDLLAIIDRLLADPAAALSIAAAARQQVHRAHGPDARWDTLSALLAGGAIDPRYDVAAEARAVHVRSRDEADRRRRIAQYEHVQERHRIEPSLTVLALPGADPRTLCDLADLARLRLSRTSRSGDSLLSAAAVIDRIGMIDPAAAAGQAWDIVIAAPDDLVEPASWITARPPGTILVTATEQMTIAGYRPIGPDDPGVYQPG